MVKCFHCKFLNCTSVLTFLHWTTMSNLISWSLSRNPDYNLSTCRTQGVLPYKSVGGARPKFSRTPLKGTRILFNGPVPNPFPPSKKRLRKRKKKKKWEGGESIATLLGPRPGLHLMMWRLQSTRRSMCDKFIFINFGICILRGLWPSPWGE